MALTAAYVLAGELHLADGDHVAAYRAYEDRLRPHVTANQELLRLGQEMLVAETGAAGPEGDTESAGPDGPGREDSAEFRAAVAFDLPDY